MHPTDRNRLRRLRILQQLQHAYPNPIGGPLLLELLLEDPDLQPDMHVVLRSLIWLEDNDLADVQVLDGSDVSEPVTVARISRWGHDFLQGTLSDIPGIYHPTDLLGGP